MSGQVTCYLSQVGYDKWEDHQKRSIRHGQRGRAHVRNQAAACRNPFLAAADPAREQENTNTMKLVAELKPDVLS